MSLSLLHMLSHDQNSDSLSRWSKMRYTNSTGKVWSDNDIVFGISFVPFEKLCFMMYRSFYEMFDKKISCYYTTAKGEQTDFNSPKSHEITRNQEISLFALDDSFKCITLFSCSFFCKTLHGMNVDFSFFFSQRRKRICVF